MLNFIFRFFSFQCCYTWIWPSRFYERWLSKVLNSRINLLFMNKRRSKWSKHDTGVTHNNATELSKPPLFEGSVLVFQKSRDGSREPTQPIPKLFRTPWCAQYTNVKENKNGIPFHDRERITNFQKYHEKITAIFQIEKWEERRTFQLDKGKYSN